MAEVAAQTAAVLVPDLRAVAFRDLTFHRFVKVHEGQQAPKTVTAQVVDRNDGGVRVSVRTSGDVVAPNGAVLVRDRVYFEGTVELRDRLPAAPRDGHVAVEITGIDASLLGHVNVGHCADQPAANRALRS